MKHKGDEKTDDRQPMAPPPATPYPTF